MYIYIYISGFFFVFLGGWKIKAVLCRLTSVLEAQEAQEGLHSTALQ